MKFAFKKRRNIDSIKRQNFKFSLKTDGMQHRKRVFPKNNKKKESIYIYNCNSSLYRSRSITTFQKVSYRYG